jgi:hypothetical protein
MCSHCLFPVVVTSLKQVVMTVTDLLQVVPTRLIQAVRNKRSCRRHQTCWNNLLRVCWPHQRSYKMITTCSRLVNNWEQAVRTHLVDKLGDFYTLVRMWVIPTNSLKNAQVVASLQICKLLQICSQAIDKLCSHYRQVVFPVVVTSLEHAVNNLEQGW